MFDHCFYCAKPLSGLYSVETEFERTTFDGEEINRMISVRVFCDVICSMKWLRWMERRKGGGEVKG